MHPFLEKHYKKILIGGVLLIAILFAANYLYRETTLKSKAALESVELTFNPNSVTGAATQEVTTTLEAQPQVPITARGYALTLNFDKTKVNLKSISYDLGKVTVGLGDDTSKIATINSTGKIKIQGEIEDAAGAVMPNSTKTKVVTLTWIIMDKTPSSVYSDATVEKAFYRINSDLTIESMPISTGTLSINGGSQPTASVTCIPQPTCNPLVETACSFNTDPSYCQPGSGYQVSGRVLINGNVSGLNPIACQVSENWEGVNGLDITLRSTTSTNKEMTVIQNGAPAMWSTRTTVGGSNQNGAFYFQNIPNGSYELCYEKANTGYQFFCTANNDPATSNCKTVLVNNANSPGHRFTVTKSGTGNATLNLKLRFQGIVKKPLDGLNSFIVKVTAVSESTNTAVDGTGTFTSDDKGIWTGSVKLNKDISDGTYKLLVKGPKHLQKKICDATPTETFPGTYKCDKGLISLKKGENTLDLSGVYLLVGDLPEQDGIVNAFDTSLVINSIGKSDSESLKLSDLNLDGIVNAQDYSLVIAALSIRNDEF